MTRNAFEGVDKVTWIIGAIGIGIMVFVHELGHFVAARLSGVEVEVLSLGWGPRLIGFKRGNTWYQISWLLLIGGYCKMKGELVPAVAGGGAEAVARGGSKPGADGVPGPQKGSFLAASPLQRIMISAFGPLFNLAFAFLAFAVIWWSGFQIFSGDNRVILQTDYPMYSNVGTPPATAVGLHTGDRIIAIDGSPVRNFAEIFEVVSVAPGKALRLTVQRASSGVVDTLSITPELDKNTGAGRIGVVSWFDPVVAVVTPNGAAAIAGLRVGDRIEQAGGMPVRNAQDFDRAFYGKPSKVVLAIVRDGSRRETSLVPSYDDRGGFTLGLGFAANVYPSPRMGPAEAGLKGFAEVWNAIVQTVKGIGLLFRGVNIRSAVMGPLGITQLIGSATASGFSVSVGAGAEIFFRLLAAISVVLFLMNLLPIPAMDGGQIVLFGVEAVRRRPVSSRVIWRLQIAGFSILVLLFVFALLNDVGRMVGR
jgi:regulator of sigma E protease